VPRDQTDLAGNRSKFPSTAWSLIRDAMDPNSPTAAASMERLAKSYWPPVYAYLRHRWGLSNEDAKDLTQEFFAALCEKRFLTRLSPEGGKFRSYVMTAMDNYVRMRHRRENRLKRGGAARRVSLDPVGRGIDVAVETSSEDVFVQEWTRTLLAEAVKEMEREYLRKGKHTSFLLLQHRDLTPGGGESLSYQILAERFKLSVGEVKTLLHRARLDLRRRLLRKVRDTVSTDSDAREELRDLFGKG